MENKQKYYRDFHVDSGTVDMENRSIKIAFSSETPVERHFGMEILSHEQGAVDLSRLNDGAPLLLQHDPDRQIGVVETSSIDPDKIGRAIVRFSKSEEAERILQDIKDGIRRKISVGYIVSKFEEVKDDVKNRVSTFIAKHWMPLEVSVVSIPADINVGVGRAEEIIYENKNLIKEEIKMENKETITNQEDLVKNERERVSEIEATSTKFVGRVPKIEELRKEAVRNGWSAEQFKGAIADKLSDGKPFETPNAELGLSNKEKQNYSIRNLILSQVPNTGVKAEYERELSAEVVKRTGKAPRGLYMPFDIMSRDMLTSGGSGAGSNLVGTQLQPQNFIEMLYNAQIATKLGAKRLTGLNQNVSIPRQSGKSTVGWVAENAAGSETNLTFQQVSLSPKSVAAYVDYSRNLLIQSLPSIENLVMSDLATSMAIAVDAAMLHGTGADGQPTGIASTSGVGGVTITSNTVSFANILEFESDVLGQNANVANCSWVTTPSIQAILKSKAKVSGDSREFVQVGNQVNGYNLYASNQVSSGYLFFGDFSDLIIGEFGNGIDLLVDPYTGSNAGTYRVVGFYSVDMAVRHPGSFSLASGITG